MQDDIPIDEDDGDDIISDNYEQLEDNKPETALVKSDSNTYPVDEDQAISMDHSDDIIQESGDIMDVRKTQEIDDHDDSDNEDQIDDEYQEDNEEIEDNYSNQDDDKMDIEHEDQMDMGGDMEEDEDEYEDAIEEEMRR